MLRTRTTMARHLLQLAKFPKKPHIRTNTCNSALLIYANSTILTGVDRLALVYVHMAALAGPMRRALAAPHADQVQAVARVTRARLAFVDV